jgi:6-phospho-beta-glucosidase
MKVAVLGGGGFRTPTLHGCLARAAANLGIEEVVLQDVASGRLDVILDVIEGMDRERGGAAIPVHATASLDDAVDGASAVLAAIRVGGADARLIDEEVPLSLGVIGQETVGPAGIAYALRTIPVMRSIAAVVRDRAPGAWFVNFTNPAGVVTQSVRDVLGDRAIGICDSPAVLCARVAAALDQEQASVDFDYAGLNHLGWLLAARIAGEDRLPELFDDEPRLLRIEEARMFGVDRLRSLGAIPNEYLVYVEHASAVTSSFRRDGARGGIVAEQQRGFYDRAPGDPAAALAAWRSARDARHGTYLAEARTLGGRHPDGSPPPDGGPGEEGYGAVAIDFLEAASAVGERRLILNTANRGRLGGIGPEEIVEVTCTVSRREVRPVPGPPPPTEAASLIARIKEVERLTLLASATGAAADAVNAIAAHPVVPSRDVAERIWSGYDERHHVVRR